MPSITKHEDSLTGRYDIFRKKSENVHIIHKQRKLTYAAIKACVHLGSESEINVEGVFKERVHLRGLYHTRESLTYKSQRKLSGACPLDSREWYKFHTIFEEHVHLRGLYDSRESLRSSLRSVSTTLN